MPSASKSQLSPAELAQLEHAFATDPTSEAYKALAEAYLAMGRFMEAMVVCKKGVKAHPETANARVLLSKVYAEQGKDKKALEEAQGALAVAPNDLGALRMCGALLCKAADPAGAEHLKKAIAADPKNAETIELCKKFGVPLPEPPKPPPPPPQRQSRIGPSPQSGAGAMAAPGLQRPASRPPQRISQTGKTRPPSRPPPEQPQVTYEQLAQKYETEDSLVRKRKGSGVGIIAMVGIMVAGALSLGGYFIYRSHKKDIENKIEKLLNGMKNETQHDSYSSYRRACDYGEQITTELDSSLFSAHAYLAYAYAIRWGEHGEDVADRAKDHLAKAKAAKTEHSHILAAEAYIDFFGGDAKAAEDLLQPIVDDKAKRSSLIMSTLGIIQMHDGDLEKAARNLKDAQTLAPSDPRINAAYGDVLRFQGLQEAAANAYQQVLRYEKDHAEAQLGVALMAIDTADRDDPSIRAVKFEAADKFVKKLISADPPPSPRQLAVAYLAHAIVLDEAGKSSEGDKEEAKAFDTDSRNAELFILKAHRRKHAGKPDECIAAIREAIKRDPKRAQYYAELANELIAKPGGAKEATEAIKLAIRSMGENPKLLYILANAQRADKDYDGSSAALEKAIVQSKDSRFPEARLLQAYNARDKKDTRAMDLFEKAKNEFTTSTKKQAECITEQGKLLEEKEDRTGALDKYKLAATKVDQTYAPPFFLMARLVVSSPKKDQRDIGCQLLEKYAELEPKGEYIEEAKRLAGEHCKK